MAIKITRAGNAQKSRSLPRPLNRITPRALIKLLKKTRLNVLALGTIFLLVYPSEIINSRYKDLKSVEADFRNSKTAFLVVRPIFLRKEARTKGYLLVTMLACKIVRKLQSYWKDFDLTVSEGLTQLSALCSRKLICDEIIINKIPTPSGLQQQLLLAAKTTLPAAISIRKADVVTKKLNLARM